MRLSDLAIDRPVTTLMFLASLVLLGTVAVFRLPLGFLPDMERARVTVSVDVTGGHPLEILRDIVEPLEDEIALVQGVLRVESEANVGSARITAEFSPWDDLIVRRLEIRDAVDRARPSLPEEIDDVRVRSGWDDDTETVFQGRISANRDLSMEWDLIEQRITSRLERVPGVAQVNLDGIDPPRVRVDLDVGALRRHRIGADRVAAAIEAANAGLALGVIRGPQLRFDVRDDSRPDSAEQIADLPIPGTTLRVGDLATVQFRPPRPEYGRTLDRRPAIGFDVFKDSQANTVAVVDGLRAEIERINEDPYLEGLSVLAFLDQAEEIRLSLKGLLKSGIFGGLLAVIVLMAFLRRLSVTIVLAVAIPFSLIVTCGVLYLLGRELDILTLTGLMLGVGMLVDNAVVVVENIHRLEQKGIAAREAARRGAGNVALAVTAATTTTILVWSWLVFTEPGELRTYAMPMAITISLTVFCSLIISLTFIPLVAARYLSSREVPAGLFEKRLIPAYRRVLDWSLRHRAATLLALFLLATSAVWPFTQLEFNSEPKEVPRWVTISYQFSDAVTLERMKEVIDVTEEAVMPVVARPEITNIYSFYHERRGFALTRLYMARGYSSESFAAELRDEVRPMLPTVPGVKITTREPNFWRHFYGGGGRERNIQLAFRGTEPETVGLVVADVRDFLEQEIPEAKEIIAPDRGGRQEARVVIDPDRVRSAGTTPDAISRSVGSMFRGRMLSRLHTETGERDVFITVPESEDQGLSDVNDLEVPLAAGGTVPLDAIADIELSRTPESIRRENQRVSSWIMVTFPQEMTTPEARAIVTERMALFDLPTGITWDFGQRGERRDDVLGTMLEGTILSLIVVMLLMAAMFESLTQPLAVFVTFPLAFFGSTWSIWFTKGELDAVGFLGVIILIGIVVNNGIVLVDHINLLRKRGRDRRTAILDGCADRIRPVLMTAITTVVGLVPLALSTFTVMNFLFDSIAIVVMGGLASSTIFTLLALPVWYSLLEDAGAALRHSVTLPIRWLAGVAGGGGSSAG